jgi:bifunctional UDP-N-acetylglucosamine pyrophosphorylase/glucosamine-1-phosphate N-acetyltransferase
MNLQIIILAAGQGKRMYSNTPKVLHPIAGKPMLSRVVETALQLNPNTIHVIYGHGGEKIKESLPDLAVNWVHQAEQLGTGHAVLQALPYLPPQSTVLILSADVPLISKDTLVSLIECTSTTNNAESSLALLVAELENPGGLGRIIRNDRGEISTIVEEKDANKQQKNIKEIYTGICCVNSDHLHSWLPNLGNNNAQKEYYLTEIINLACNNQVPITSITVKDEIEVQGVNNRLQLAQLERAWQTKQAQKFLEQGVMIADPSRFDLRGELKCGIDVFIDVNCIFTGTVTLGAQCIIGPNCTLTNVTLGDHCEIHANSVIEGSHLGSNCHIGPFARLREGTQLQDDCKIGNFVETKKTKFGKASKASHLSYLGDTLIGSNVNIGAGTITCNYDGVNKHQTIIEDGAFIGSDTQLVAPVTVGSHATIGAGTTLRKDAPPGELTLSESRQKTVFGWKRPTKKERT